MYNGINCPAGHYKVSQESFAKGCPKIGLYCNKTSWDCYCKPCIKAFEVDVYPFKEGEIDFHDASYTGVEKTGCSKMSLCGKVQQTKTITFRAYDNTKRVGATVTVLMHLGSTSNELEVRKINGTWAYEFTWVRHLIPDKFNALLPSTWTVRLTLPCLCNYGLTSKEPRNSRSWHHGSVCEW